MNTNNFFHASEVLRVDVKENFTEVKSELQLESKLSAFDLSLLHRAAFRAALCNIAFNGLGGCLGKIKPKREEHRRSLEITFTHARKCVYASESWVALDPKDRNEIARRLLTVRVAHVNLAS